MSLRLRVTLLALAALVVGLLAAGVVVPILVERFLTDRLDDQLRGVAPAALRFLDPQVPRYDPNRLRPPNAMPIYVERQAPDGTHAGGNLDGQAATNPPRLPEDLDLVHEQLFTVSGRASGRYRVMVIDSAFDPGATYAIGLPDDGGGRHRPPGDHHRGGGHRRGRARRRRPHLVVGRRGATPAAAHGGHGPGDRRDRRAWTGPAPRAPVHQDRDRPAGRHLEHDARPHRRLLLRTAGDRGEAAPLRRRRLARAAHPL